MKKLIVGALSCGLLLLAGCRNNLVEPKHKSSADDYAIIQSSSHKKSHKKVEQPKKKSEDKKKIKISLKMKIKRWMFKLTPLIRMKITQAQKLKVPVQLFHL
ncbi:hypothetical protein [Lactobacillus paragasseri]|uniref:hypothetical protein n=1 Tax=Lactobacillus paragasseri TaxID=2107999 RepID=UPI00321BBA32